MRVLLWIPKNLVYFFILIIVFAFCAMLYITSTEKDLSEFLSYDRTQEVIVVDPVLQSMVNYMHLDEYKIPVVTMKEYSTFKFFDDYLSENRPVILKGYAKDWPAISEWSDLDSFKNKTDGNMLRVTSINRDDQNFYPNKDSKKNGLMVKSDTAVAMLRNNTQAPDSALINFIWYDLLRVSSLKNDYKFPVLHDFLPFQMMRLSIWP